MKKVLLIFLVSLFALQNTSAKTKKVKFGRVSKEELQMKYYEPDSSAKAVILYDKGYSYFEYDNYRESFKLIFERHVRIKFFDKESFKYADFEIPLYVSDKGISEEIVSIKGITFNLVDGKIVRTKLNKKGIYNEETLKNWITAKFTLPAINEGCIIDLKYTINSIYYFNFQPWQFQYKIPVKYSEYSALIPEYFRYNKKLKGYTNININETETIKDESFSVDWRSTPQRGGKVVKGTSELLSESVMHKWTAQSIPAFKTETEITTYKDYISILYFELESKQFPGKRIKYYSNSWENVSKTLLKSRNFGKQFKIRKKIKNKSDEICKDLDSKSEKLGAIYNFVQNEITWDERSKLFTSSNLDKILEQKSGNSTDINFLLMNMLRAQKIQANPIIISTRDNGRIFPSSPSIFDFNYVIIEAKIDNHSIYLDATIDIIPAGLLPKRCLNGYGRKILINNSAESFIVPSGKFSKTIMYTVNISDENILNADVSKIHNEYAAIVMRNKIIKSGGKDDYIQSQVESYTGQSISDYLIDDYDNIYKPVKESYKISTSDNIIFAGNLIYLSPLLNEAMTENPFKLEERNYPVDFAYPKLNKIIMQYKIPEGYTIEEVPENISLSLPNKAAQFQFQVVVMNDMIQIISIFKINQSIFQYDSYKALRNLYNLIIEKQNEKIVLKKVN